MLRSLTQSMSALHTWGGLVFGGLLFAVLLSGSAAVYHSELTTWLTPEQSATAPPDRARSLAIGEAWLRANAPAHRLWRITLPSTREPVVKVAFRAGPTPNGDARLDGRTGARLLRETEGGEFYLKLHEGLHIDRGKNRVGLYIVGLAGVAMMVAAISGVIVHKRILKDMFLFRPAASRQRSWLDAHNVLGVLPLPFHVIMAFTGLLLLYWMYLPAGVQALYGGKEAPFRAQAILLDLQQPPKGDAGPPRATLPLLRFVEAAEPVIGRGTTASLWIHDIDRANARVEVYRERTDRVSQQVPQVMFAGADGRVLRVVAQRTPAAEVQAFLAALHWIEWGGPAVRLVYLLAGLAGAGAVAAGLVVFTTKRRRRPEGAAAWFRMVEALNVAAVAGCCIASIAFLWAERLTPVETAARAGVGVSAFFWTWLLTLAHAGMRGDARAAWVEQLALAGALAVGAPWLGGEMLRHLAPGEGVRLGIDLGLLAIGAGLLAAAWKAARAPRITAASALQPRRA